MALRDRPVLAAAAGAACIASSATLVSLADTAPATAATFRCLYALPFLGVLMLLEDRRLGRRPLRARLIAADLEAHVGHEACALEVRIAGEASAGTRLAQDEPLSREPRKRQSFPPSERVRRGGDDHQGIRKERLALERDVLGRDRHDVQVIAGSRAGEQLLHLD